VRRKIIKQGHNTLTVTLPSGWAAANKLKAGHEIDIVENDASLIICAQKPDDQLCATIDIRELDIPTIWKYYMAAVREGYDEIQFLFDPHARYPNPYKYYKAHSQEISTGSVPKPYTPHEMILTITSRFVGMEVVESHNDRCIVKDISETSPKEFQTSLRRVFLLIKQMAHEMQDAIRTENPQLITHAEDADITVDKFNDFCLRVLNKNGREIRKPHIMFSILCVLELIGDEFKHTCYHILEDMKGKPLRNLLDLERMIAEQFDLFYDLFYAYSAKKVVALSEHDFRIHMYLPQLERKRGRKVQLSTIELEIFNHFRRIGHYINELIELRVEMEF
jgi:phosphate uptake regulator